MTSYLITRPQSFLFDYVIMRHNDVITQILFPSHSATPFTSLLSFPFLSFLPSLLLPLLLLSPYTFLFPFLLSSFLSFLSPRLPFPFPSFTISFLSHSFLSFPFQYFSCVSLSFFSFPLPFLFFLFPFVFPFLFIFPLLWFPQLDL